MKREHRHIVVLLLVFWVWFTACAVYELGWNQARFQWPIAIIVNLVSNILWYVLVFSANVVNQYPQLLQVSSFSQLWYVLSQIVEQGNTKTKDFLTWWTWGIVAVLAERSGLSKMSLMVLGMMTLLFLMWVWGTQPLFFTIAKLHVPPVSPARLETHVRMLSETFFPRDVTHPDNLDRVAAYIRHEFMQVQGRVSEQPYIVAGRTYRNVLALFGPDTKERIVVGAHYDTAGMRPGADDNASGVAGLIELASLLREASLPLCVELVAFTLEEEPHLFSAPMGSAVHAASLRQHNIPVRVMFSLEMIGYFTDTPHSQHFPLPFLAAVYPSQGNFIAIVGNLSQGLVVRQIKQAMRSASSLPVHSLNAPNFVPGVDFSDHRNYWQAGYNAVMVTDTAFYRNARYHTDHDTAATLDYERMAMVVQGVYAAILASAHSK